MAGKKKAAARKKKLSYGERLRTMTGEELMRDLEQNTRVWNFKKKAMWLQYFGFDIHAKLMKLTDVEGYDSDLEDRYLDIGPYRGTVWKEEKIANDVVKYEYHLRGFGIRIPWKPTNKKYLKVQESQVEA